MFFSMLLKDFRINFIYVCWRLYKHMREYSKAFTCVTFISLICGSILPYTSLLASFLLFNLRNLISPSWCSTPGLNSGQTAALFILLVINITQCNAAFADNYTGNGAPALLQLFSSWPRCCRKSHSCEQQAHSLVFLFFSRLFRFFFFFFKNLITSSVLTGAIFSCWLQGCDCLADWPHSGYMFAE